MNRRDLIAGLGAAAALASGRASAQAPLPIVGFLGTASAEAAQVPVEAFRRGLREVGQLEGRTIRFEARHAGGDVGKMDALIAELVALPVAVILVRGPGVAKSLRRISTTLPIVCVGAIPGSDPELFASIARPGGSFTGFSSLGEELSGKQIGILREALPNLKTHGIMHNGTDPTFTAWGDESETAARAQGLKPIRVRIVSTSATALAEQMKQFRADGGTAMIVVSDFMTITLQSEISRLGIALGLAVIGDQRSFAEAGMLMTYGADLPDLFRRAAGHVDRILKGTKPGDLAIQLPVKFEMALNLKTAYTLGLNIPMLVRAQADELIE